MPAISFPLAENLTEHYISLAAMMRKQEYGEPFPRLPQSVVGGSGASVAHGSGSNGSGAAIDLGHEAEASRVLH